MGSKSSNSSNNGCLVRNEGTDYVKKIIKHDHPWHKCYITRVYKNYKAAGKNNFHRFLEFEFECRDCGFEKIVKMDKTVGDNNKGYKNIACSDVFLNQSGLLHWEYKPQSDNYDIDDLINIFNDASSRYHLLKDNCNDFANYIINRLGCKEI